MAVTREQLKILTEIMPEVQKSEAFTAWRYHLDQCWLCRKAKNLTVMSGESVFPGCNVGLNLMTPALEFLKGAYEKALAKPEPESKPND